MAPKLWFIKNRTHEAAGFCRDFEAMRETLERSSETIFKNFLKISGILR